MATKKTRRNYAADFKLKIAYEALQGVEPATELSKRYGVHPNRISRWKRALSDSFHRIFEKSHPEKDDRDRLIEARNRQIVTLTADLIFLKKKLKPYL